MIKEFFDELERVLEEKIRGCSCLSGLKVEKKLWYQEKKGETIKEGDFEKTNEIYKKLKKEGGDVAKFFPQIYLYDEKSCFRLCLEYNYQKDTEYVYYGVHDSRVSSSEIMKNDTLNSVLSDTTNCEKLKSLFKNILFRYTKSVCWFSGDQTVFDEVASETNAKTSSRDFGNFYFSVVKYGLESIMTSDNCYERMKSVLSLVEEMFDDALKITW